MLKSKSVPNNSKFWSSQEAGSTVHFFLQAFIYVVLLLCLVSNLLVCQVQIIRPGMVFYPYIIFLKSICLPRHPGDPNNISP